MLKPRTIIAKYLLVYYLICNEGIYHVAGNEGSGAADGQNEGEQGGVVISGQGSSVAKQVAATLSGSDQTHVSPPNGAAQGQGENLSGSAPEESQSSVGDPSSSDSTKKSVTLVHRSNLIELDVSNKADTDKVEYYRKEADKIDVFEAKDSHFFYKIKEGNNVLWESKTEVYPKKAYATLNTSGKTKLRLFYSRKAHIQIDKDNSINLNINYKKSNQCYDYARTDEDSLDSFKCKDGYKIRLLQKGPHVLWAREANKEYAVEIDVFTTKEDKLAIVIYLEGGGRLICFKDNPDSQGKPVFKCEQEEEDIKLVSPMTEQDSSTPELKSAAEYPVSQKTALLQIFTQGSSSPNDTTKYDHEKKGNRDIYTFKDGAKCREIKVGKESLWRSSSDDKYPKKVTHYFNVLNITFNNDEGFIYMKKEGQWEHSIRMSQEDEHTEEVAVPVQNEDVEETLEPEGAPSVSSDPIKIEGTELDDIIIIDNRDKTQPTEASTHTQVADPEEDSGEDIDLSGFDATSTPESTVSDGTTGTATTGGDQDGTTGTTPESGTDGTATTDQDGTTVDQDATATTGDDADGSGTTGGDQDGTSTDADGTSSGTATTVDQDATATTGDDADGSGTTGEDQEETSESKEGTTPESSPAEGAKEGTASVATPVTPPPIPPTGGQRSTAQPVSAGITVQAKPAQATPASTSVVAARPKSRSVAKAAPASRPTGGISISLDDDEDTTGSPQSQERWVRATGLPKLSYYPLYKFVPRLEISTLDPSDSQKTVVNDTNSYEISHEKGNIIYKFKSNTKCVLIKCDDKDLWKRGRGEDENEMYPQYIVMVSRFIFVVFEGYFKLYQKKMDECKELYDSTPELKQLNIRKNNEKFYDYIKDDKAKIYKYLVKNDVLFNSVKKGKNSCNCGTELAIWDTKFPEEYATKVIRKESGKKDKYLCVYYYNGNYSLFFKRKGAKFWQDETSEKFFSSDFRFHTLNEKGTQYEELEPSKREVTLDGFIKRYKFTVGADCHEIRCRNVKLWSHDKIKFGDDYPKEMSLNLLNNQVTVKLDAVHFVYDYNGEDLIWKLNSVDMGEYYMARLTVVTVDENGSNSSENNTNRYELNKYKTGLAYKIKENGKFTEVKNGSKSMWRHVDGSDHPKILYHDIRNNTLFIRFKDSVGICNGGESRSVKAGEDVPKVDDLLLVTLDDNGNRKENKTKESADTQDGSSPEENETGDSSSQNPGNDSSKKNHPPDFTKEAMDNEETIRRYIFGDKVRCVEVKLGGESLWTHEVNKHGREYPKEIIVNLAIATLTINFDSQLNYIYVHDGDKWKLESENNLFDYYLNKFTIVTADDGEGNNSRENDELEYSIEKQNNLFTLFLHEEAKCIKVKYEEQVVWSYKQENADAFARSVSCNPQSGSLAVDTDGGSFKFTMENGLWTAVDPSVPLPVSKHPQGLTIITLEEGAEGAEERVENNYNLYNVYDRGNDCYLYHFPEGVKCVEFRFGDRKIWSYHLKYKNKYPESITVELGPGIVEIEIGDKTLPYRLYEEE